jgi:hypothetical protein
VHCYCDALWSLTQPHLISDDGTALLECIRHTSTLEWEERLSEIYSDLTIVSATQSKECGVSIDCWRNTLKP